VNYQVARNKTGDVPTARNEQDRDS
jgi:hypothetical protein